MHKFSAFGSCLHTLCLMDEIYSENLSLSFSLKKTKQQQQSNCLPTAVKVPQISPGDGSGEVAVTTGSHSAVPMQTLFSWPHRGNDGRAERGMIIIFHLTVFPVICKKTKKNKRRFIPSQSFQCQHGPVFSTVASKRGGHKFGSDTRPFCVSQCVFSLLCTSASSHAPKTYKNDKDACKTTGNCLQMWVWMHVVSLCRPLKKWSWPLGVTPYSAQDSWETRCIQQMHELICTELWKKNIQHILYKHLLNLVYVEFIFISKRGHSGRCRMCF